MPYFSIIIPVYNVAPYLRECLDSVLKQSFADWEAICVNDGSTDGSGAILDEYAAKDKRFRVFHKENGGVSSARNLALDNARGEWIWFVDGDDVIWGKALYEFRNIFKLYNDKDSLSFECINLDEECFKNADSIFLKTNMINSFSMLSFARFNRGGTVTLYKKELIGYLRFKKYRMSEDTLFSIEYFFKSKHFLDCNLTPYFRRLRIGSATRRPPDALYMKDWFNAQKDILDCIGSNKAKFSAESWSIIMKSLANSFYYTNEFRYFRLPAREYKELFPLWLSNLGRLKALGKIPLYQRVVFSILYVVRVPILAKVLVRFPYVIFKYLRLLRELL